MSKINRKIKIQEKVIAITSYKDEDYICLTDMVKSKDGNFFITDWLRNKNTLEFMSVWEQMHNPDFNYGEFATISSKSGLNSFKISVKEWTEATGAIGIYSKAGRYGGTYAHRDIAFEFGTWISPTFKMYLIKEYQRLKERENNQYNLEWNVKRILSKANYQLQTRAIQQHIIPTSKYQEDQQWLSYAEEADLLNIALFGCTAKEWRQANPKLDKQGFNIRDFASINELAVLSNLESLNAEFIYNHIPIDERFEHLKRIAEQQLAVLDSQNIIKSIKKLSDSTYPDIDNKLNK